MSFPEPTKGWIFEKYKENIILAIENKKVMIEHIVMFRLHSENKGQLNELKDKLDALEDKIDEVLRIETGINFAVRSDAYDLILKVHVKDDEGLKAYAEHPEHEQVLKFVKQVVDQMAVVDFVKE